MNRTVFKDVDDLRSWLEENENNLFSPSTYFYVDGISFYMADQLALMTCHDSHWKLYTWEDYDEILYWIQEQIDKVHGKEEV